MAATAGAGGEWEICNDDGFVYKRPRGLYPTDRDGAGAAVPSTPGPPPESVLLQRRRRALLSLRDKYLLELSRWEALSSEVLAPLPTPSASPPRAPPASPLPVAASAPTTSSDRAVLDDLLAQAEVQEQMLKKLSQMCDEMDEFCSAHEAALVDAVTALPVWGNPRELVDSLCSPAEQAVPEMVGSSPQCASLSSADQGEFLYTPPRSTDPAWQYIRLTKKNCHNSVKCMLCKKYWKAGINRMRKHLAGIPGDIQPCEAAPSEIQKQFRDLVESVTKKKEDKNQQEDELQATRS